MTKIIHKNEINIEELKILLDNGIRVILLGDFSDDEKQFYYSMGIYNLASTKEEAEVMEEDGVGFDKISIGNEDKFEEKIVEHEVKVSKPGIFTKPVKLTLAGLAVVGIAGASITAFGLTNKIVKPNNIVATSDEISIKDSVSSSDKLNKADVIVLTEATREASLIDISESNNGSDRLVEKFNTKPIETKDIEESKWEETQKIVNDNGGTEFKDSSGNTVAGKDDDTLIVGDKQYDVSNLGDDITIKVETPEENELDITNQPNNDISQNISNSMNNETNSESDDVADVDDLKNENTTADKNILEEAKEHNQNISEKMDYSDVIPSLD